MTNPLNKFFDGIYWIGSKHRPDRSTEMQAQLDKFGIVAQRFEAHWKPNGSGNAGCTASHRGVLEIARHRRHARTLILEDDAQFVDDQWPEMFESMVTEVPDDWCFLFLGAGYAEDPKRRVSGSVIQANALMTTSSYGITLDMVERLCPHICGVGPIDSLYFQFQRDNPTYIFDPRLMVQREGWSDLQDQHSKNEVSMLDRRHVCKLDGDEYI